MDSMLNAHWIKFLIVVAWLSISTTFSDSTDRNARSSHVDTRVPRLGDMVAKPSASIRTSVLNRRRHGFPNIQHSSNKVVSIPCPKGHKVQHYVGRVRCSPVIYPVSTGSKILDCLATPGCGFSKHPTIRHNGCPYGTNKIISMGRIHCADQYPKQFESPGVYDREQPYKHQRIMETNHEVPVDIPECDDGKVAAMTENGYVCVDPVFPASVCPDDRVPAMSRDGIQCIPCPLGTTITRTSDGVKCESVEASRSEQCPEGLLPLSTAAGTVCQYVPVSTHHQRVSKEPGDSMADHSNPCKTGEILIVSNTGSVCHAPVSKDDIEHSQDIGVRVCDYGYVLVQSTLSFTCLQGSIPEYVFPMCGPNFVFAKLHHEYKCITQVDARVVCQAPQVLSHVDDGFHCIETEHSSATNQYIKHRARDTQCGQYQQYDIYLRKCVPNHADVANNGNPFICPRGQTFSKLTRSCIPGYRCFAGQTFSRLTGACVSDTFCPPGQTFNEQARACVSKSYCPTGQTFSERIGGCVTCRPGLAFNTKTGKCMNISQAQVNEQVLCNHGQVIHTDENGKQQCISMNTATDLCGIGYIAVGDNGGFVCKMERQDVICPRDYTLTISNDQPLCVKGGCSTLSIPYTRMDSTIGGCYQLPVCEENYSMNHDVNGPYCVLHVRQTSTRKVVTPCNGNSSIGGCDIPADKLLQGCNPDCANGGTCLNDTCVCPPGITGRGCHLDVDECQNQPCDYRCINTFGSFQCTCPTGMALTMDGIACKVAGCLQPCLNNGTCRNGHCICNSGFEGEHCEKDKDECALHGRRLCQYKCRNSYGGYQCICPPGSRLNRDGRTCKNTTCHPECRNGGVCRNHKCQCPTGFFGIICQFDVNECRSHEIPCEQICNNTWGSYHCSCSEGYILQPDNKTCK